MDFIDKISKDALFSTGKKLSRATIIHVIIEAMRKLNLSGYNIHSADELEQRILEVAKKILPNITEDIKKRTENDSKK